MSKKLGESCLKFWEQQAQKLPWFAQWTQALQWNEPFAHWFVDGQINASYACLDVNIINGLQNKTAIIWENEQGDSETITYGQLFDLVNNFAFELKSQGVKSGDIIVIYLPMIPQAIIAMLAVARLGATHCIVFSGFSQAALKDRINDTQAKFIITTDTACYRGKTLEPKKTVDAILAETISIEKVIVIERDQLATVCPPWFDTRTTCAPTTSGTTAGSGFSSPLIPSEFAKQICIEGSDLRSKSYRRVIQAVPVESNHPLFILYTSGTSGKPKGIVHSTGGYLTYVYATIKWAFDINKDSIYWCSADIGWITGHSYVVYGPLMHGATIYIREGAPDYPDQSAWWQAIERHKISIFYTSPTALRMFMKMGNEQILKHDLSSLKILGSVGEPINPEVWNWFNDVIGKKMCPIIDTWWQTETGGFMICPAVGPTERDAGRNSVKLKPGSATHPLPQIDADIVDQNGFSVPAQTKGHLVIKKPWPGMAIGIHNNPQAFKDFYWSKFPGMYYSGDYAIKDKDGYFWLLGRADEVLKISGHRIGTAEIESETLKIEAVAETAVIGIPDEIRGEAIVIFSILKSGFEPSIEIKNEIIQAVRKQIGAFAAPKEIYFVENLPKTRSGKIMRRLLKSVVMGTAIGDLSTLEDGTSLEEIQAIYQGFKQQLVATR